MLWSDYFSNMLILKNQNHKKIIIELVLEVLTLLYNIKNIYNTQIEWAWVEI